MLATVRTAYLHAKKSSATFHRSLHPHDDSAASGEVADLLLIGPALCHAGASDKSSSAAKYLADIEYVAGDGYQPVVVKQPKGTYNQSWVRSLQQALTLLQLQLYSYLLPPCPYLRDGLPW